MYACHIDRKFIIIVVVIIIIIIPTVCQLSKIIKKLKNRQQPSMQSKNGGMALLKQPLCFWPTTWNSIWMKWKLLLYYVQYFIIEDDKLQLRKL